MTQSLGPPDGRQCDAPVADYGCPATAEKIGEPARLSDSFLDNCRLTTIAVLLEKLDSFKE